MTDSSSRGKHEAGSHNRKPMRTKHVVGLGFAVVMIILAVGIFSSVSFKGKTAEKADSQPVQPSDSAVDEAVVPEEPVLDETASEDVPASNSKTAAEAVPSAVVPEKSAENNKSQMPAPTSASEPEPEAVTPAPEPETVAPDPKPEPVAPAPEPAAEPEPEPEPAGPTGTVSAESSVMSFGEGIGFAKIKITCNCSGGAVTFFFKTSDGSATDGADYMGNPGGAYMTFEPGQTSKSIGFLIANDTESEGNENFYISISTSHPDVTVATPKVTMTIEDNE